MVSVFCVGVGHGVYRIVCVGVGVGGQCRASGRLLCHARRVWAVDQWQHRWENHSTSATNLSAPWLCTACTRLFLQWVEGGEKRQPRVASDTSKVSEQAAQLMSPNKQPRPHQQLRQDK